MTAVRSRDFDRWVLLTLRPDGNRLFVDYADECGARAASGAPRVIDSSTPTLRMRDEPSFAGLQGLGIFFPEVLVAAELESWLREGFSDRNETRPHLLPDEGHSIAVPWLLPVFVQPPRLPSSLPWETWIEHLLFGSPDLATRCVVMRAVPLQPVESLELPLKVEGIGSTVPLLENLRRRNWYAQSAAVRQYGLRLIPQDATAYDECDIVFRPLGEPLPAWGDRLRRRPRLVVSIADENPWLRRADVPQPEPGMSHLLVMPASGRSLGPAAADIATHVVYALVHDFALHEIAWIIRRFVPGTTTWTATDPQANHALRMASAMRDMIDDVRARRPHLKHELPSLISDFRFESRGLTAMSNFLAGTARLRPIEVLLRDPGFGRALADSEPPNPRRADVTVESYDAFGVLRPIGFHERKKALLRGWRYRLRVHIGWPDPDSAVSGDAPDFDSLLPPPDGTVRAIEVAVFAKSFELVSPAVQTIQLAPEGESAPVHFELRAPQRCGPADLRIAFYWNNNLLQSFVLEGEIGAGDTSADARVPLTVTLASTGIDEFDGLDRLRPRALSVALNDDIAPGSHTVMVKGTGWREEVPLNGEEMGKTMDRFRAILQAAGAAPPAGFEVSIRKMAALGRGIWDMLAVRNTGEVAVLESLRLGMDQVLQFVRHGSGRPFPWQAVYDYTLPQGNAFLNARICYGGTAPVRALDPGEKGCPHCPGDDVVCVEGFWIARHRFELLSEDLGKGSGGIGRAQRACAPESNPLVMLGVGTPSLAASALSQALHALLGPDLVDIKPSDAPVGEMLWKPERRPALFVVLSHLLEGDEDMYLPVRMNAFASNPESDGASISVPVLTSLMARGRWTDPQRPMVLLLACQSARRDVGELTSLTDAFLASGAAAVAGTEWDVMTDVAADFAQHLIKQTVGKSPQAALGEAMKQFANSCLRNSNLSAFIFTVYGNADLTIGRP